MKNVITNQTPRFVSCSLVAYYLYRIVIITCAVACGLYLVSLSFPGTVPNIVKIPDIKSFVNAPPVIDPKTEMLTNLGKTSYNKIEKDVYNYLGYEVVKYEEPFATVRQKNPKSCDKVFEGWLDVATSYNYSQVPPQTIPAELKEKYTLNDHVYVNKYYFDQRPVKSGDRIWSSEVINKFLNDKKIQCHSYPGEGEAMYYATKYFGLSNKTGVVIGSIDPWVEAFCLKNGAKKLVTLEYDKILSSDPRLQYAHPIELAKNWHKYQNTFDFAASFSSIEHSGLGRYGDPIDPIGDIREMQKVRCLLKDNALFFLGLPSGMDGIFFNAHRIYGRLRLPMIFDGFELLNVFYGKNEQPHKMSTEYFNTRAASQRVFVLRKKS